MGLDLRREVEVARHGQQFKDKAVARLLPPESASASGLSREIGVSQKYRFPNIGSRFTSFSEL
ncbi:hypothetical protein XarjCFBP7653_05920 [Xanthomonas arboricola]|nr:hypothetical protein XarjCFBP7653_05920 [Xanthomonas arboricola]